MTILHVTSTDPFSRMYYTNSINKLWDIGKSISSCMPITVYNKISWVTMASYEPTQQPIVSKRARLGRYFCFCSSLPNMAMVAMHKLEWTSKNVEQLASTRAISAAINAFPNTDSPGHPYPYHKQLSLFN
jgi:hypothetical protein